MEEFNKVREIVSEVEPDRAREIMSKYEAVRVGLADFLAGPYSSEASLAEAQLSDITDEMSMLAEASVVEAENNTERKRELVQALEENLDGIAESLGILMDETSVELTSVVSIEGILVSAADFLYPLGIDIDVKDEVSRYESIPDFLPKPDITKLGQFIDEMRVIVGDSDEMRAFLYSRKGDLSSILGLLLNGSSEVADRRMSDLFTRIDAFEKALEFREKIGVEGLTMPEVSSLILFWREDGLTPAKALPFIEEIKASEDYKKLHLEGLQLVQFLATGVSLLASGKARERASFARMFSIEAEFSSRMKSIRDDIDSNQRKIEDYSRKISGEQESSRELFNKRIALLQSNISVCNERLLTLQYKTQIAKAKYQVSIELLKKPGVNPASQSTIELIEKINGFRKTEPLKDFCKKHGVNVPTVVMEAEIIYTKYEASKVQREIDKWILHNDRPGWAYNNLLDNGRINSRNREMFGEQLSYQLEQFSKLEGKAHLQVTEIGEYFANLPYTSLDEVPEGKKEEVSNKAMVYMLAIGELREAQGRLMGVASTVELIYGPLTPPNNCSVIDTTTFTYVLGKEAEGLGGPDDTQYLKNSEWISHLQAEFGQADDELMKISTFMGGREKAEKYLASQPKMEQLSMSPLFEPLLGREKTKFGESWDKEMKGVETDAWEVAKVPKLLEKYYENPDRNRFIIGSPFDILQDGIAAADKLVDSLYDSRSNLKGLKSEIQAALDDHSLYEKHPQLKEVRETLLGQAIERIDFFLNDDESPLSLAGIAEAKKIKPQFVEMLDKITWDTLKMVGAVVVIVAAAVVTAGAAAAGAGALFGVAGSGAAFTVGAGTSFAITTGATAAGATVGMRLGMHGTNALGLTNMEVDWSLGALSKDFVVNWALSAAILGVAGRASSTVRAMQYSDDLAVQLRGTMWNARMQSLKASASPVNFSEAGKQGLRLGAVRTGNEVGQELVQTTVESAGPAGGALSFGLGVVFSWDGMDIDTSALAGKVGAGVDTEGNMVYGAKTATEFVQNLQLRYAGTDVDITTDIKQDGTVDVSMETLAGRHEFSVKPAEVGLEADVEIARVKGLEKGPNGAMRVVSSRDIGRVIFDLENNLGFRVLRATENGFIVAKGDYEAEIEIEQTVREKIATNMGKVSDAMNSLTNSLVEFAKNPDSLSLYQNVYFKAMTLAMTMTAVGCGGPSVNPHGPEAAAEAFAKGAEPGFIEGVLGWVFSGPGPFLGTVTGALLVVGVGKFAGGAILKKIGSIAAKTVFAGPMQGTYDSDAMSKLWEQWRNPGVKGRLKDAQEDLAKLSDGAESAREKDVVRDLEKDWDIQLEQTYEVKWKERAGPRNQLDRKDDFSLRELLVRHDGIKNKDALRVLDGELKPAFKALNDELKVLDEQMEAAQTDAERDAIRQKRIDAIQQHTPKILAAQAKLAKLIDQGKTVDFRARPHYLKIRAAVLALGGFLTWYLWERWSDDNEELTAEPDAVTAPESDNSLYEELGPSGSKEGEAPKGAGSGGLVKPKPDTTPRDIVRPAPREDAKDSAPEAGASVGRDAKEGEAEPVDPRKEEAPAERADDKKPDEEPPPAFNYDYDPLKK